MLSSIFTSSIQLPISKHQTKQSIIHVITQNSSNLPFPSYDYSISKNLYLAIPASCQLSKSQILYAFFSENPDFSNSSLDVLRNFVLHYSNSSLQPSHDEALIFSINDRISLNSYFIHGDTQIYCFL